MGLVRTFLSRFNYDGATSSPRRRQPPTRLMSEDRHLRAQDRTRLVANARDLARNYSAAAWAVRCHLDRVASHSFQSRTGNSDLDAQIESLMKTWSRVENCDIAGRHPLARLIRLAECGRVIDGDVFAIKLSSGRLQFIEGDRIRTPSQLPEGTTAEEWVHGVRTAPSGRALAYAVSDRRGAGFDLRSIIPARHMLTLGYYDRFDQVRGISPLAAALNPYRDVMEASEYALAKAKVSQLFGLAFYRDAAQGDDLTDMEGGEEADAGERQPYTFNFGQGPQVLDLDPGDRAEFLESRSPSTEFRNFADFTIHVAMKALDLPRLFWDEDSTFAGGRLSVQRYEESVKAKQADVREFLDKVTSWRLGLWIADGELTLPRNMTLADLAWEWMPSAMPLAINPVQEVKSHEIAIANGLDSPQRILARQGADYESVLREKLEAERMERDLRQQMGLTPEESTNATA